MLKRTLLFIGALVLLCAFSFNDDYQGNDTAARLARLETLMNLVLQRLGIDPNEAVSGGPSEEIQRLLMRGKKIEAIKVYRAQTGADLKEAKDAIDAIERQMRGY
jgi:ribosomal protein L7/L12